MLCGNCLTEIKESQERIDMLVCKNCGATTKYFTADRLKDRAYNMALRAGIKSLLSEIKKRVRNKDLRVSIGNYSFPVSAEIIEKVVTINSENLKSVISQTTVRKEGLVMLKSFIAKEKKRIEKAIGEKISNATASEIIAWVYDQRQEKPAEIITHLIKEDELGKEFVLRPDIRKTDEKDSFNVSLFSSEDRNNERVISGKAKIKYIEQKRWSRFGGGHPYIAKVKPMKVPLTIMQFSGDGGVLHIFKIED